MYTDLFSSMDGARSASIWVLPMVVVYSLSLPGLWNSGLMSTLWYKNNALWFNSTTKSLNIMPTMALSLFMFLLINNVLGLSPYSYYFTSNLFMVGSLSILFWLTLLWSGYVKSPIKSLAHLAPSGAPLMLLPFLVLVETISILIRPLTLTVRLVANISAGHIVLSLLATLNSSLMSSVALPLCTILYISYSLFEFFVSGIQAYIFTLLITLYCAEHP